MRISFTPAAVTDLNDIQLYIAEDDPASALSVVKRIRTVTENLATFPELGRPWEGGPTRALSIAGVPYRIHYRIKDDELQILRIYHTSRLPPEFLESE